MSKRDRIEACKMVATVLSGKDEKPVIPYAWSLAVFFEQYITKGAKGTLKDFGPKKPAKLKAIK